MNTRLYEDWSQVKHTHRPWKDATEVPVGALLSHKNGTISMILWAKNRRFGWHEGRNDVIERFPDYNDVNLDDALTYIGELQYSIDNGKTWNYCGVKL